MLRCSRTNHIYRSAHVQCGAKRLKQSHLAEWLEQALYGTSCECLWTNRFVLVAGDEDDWDLLLANFKFALEAEARHPWHSDVENQTSGPADAIGGEEFFRR